MMQDFSEQRNKLVDYLVASGVLKTPSIIEAFRKVKREDFVLPQYKKYAYVDEPLPIVGGQTISQPTTVAIMTEAINPKKSGKVLEIGSGSGYQSAILRELSKEVHTIEIVKEVYEFAKNNLLNAGYDVNIYHKDGGEGLPEKAPFDKIIITCAAPKIPDPLKEQLKEGGKLIVPLGAGFNQEMTLLKKRDRKFEKEFLGFFAFVPLTGKFGKI